MIEEINHKAFKAWLLPVAILTACLYVLIHVSQQQLSKVKSESLVLNNKTRIVASIHNELIAISNSHYQILHASTHSEADSLLIILNRHINNYLVQMHQLEKMATVEDEEILAELKDSFNHWFKLNREVQGYAGMIASTQFISILNRLNLTFSQIENSEDGTLLLISQMDSSNNEERKLSN